MKPEHNYAHNLFCPLVNFEQILHSLNAPKNMQMRFEIFYCMITHSQLNKAF